MKRGRIIHGDALIEMSKLPDDAFDVVLVDPPYSSGATTEAGKTRATAAHRMTRKERTQNAKWFGTDSLSSRALSWFVRECAIEWRRLLRPGGHVLCFIDWRMEPFVSPAIESADFRRNNLVVWDKVVLGMGNGYRNQHELILHFSKGKPNKPPERDVPNVLSWKPPHHSKRRHPTEKPVPLLRSLLRATCPVGGTVLDCFAGSGATGVAATMPGKLAHKPDEVYDVAGWFVGIEREREFVEISRTRL